MWERLHNTKVCVFFFFFLPKFKVESVQSKEGPYVLYKEWWKGQDKHVCVVFLYCILFIESGNLSFSCWSLFLFFGSSRMRGKSLHVHSQLIYCRNQFATPPLCKCVWVFFVVVFYVKILYSSVFALCVVR